MCSKKECINIIHVCDTSISAEDKLLQEQSAPVAEVDSDGELDNAADWRWGTDDCVL